MNSPDSGIPCDSLRWETALMGDAKQSIDFASYALTDPIIIDALNAAERRGVAIRIVLDRVSATTS